MNTKEGFKMGSETYYACKCKECKAEFRKEMFFLPSFLYHPKCPKCGSTDVKKDLVYILWN